MSDPTNAATDGMAARVPAAAPEPQSVRHVKWTYNLLPLNHYVRWRAQWIAHKRRRRGQLELDLIPFLADRDRIGVDIGANRGLFSHTLSTCCRKVVAYEPNPWMVRFLREANLQNVEIRAAAVSDRAGTIELNIPQDASGRMLHNRGSIERVGTGPEQTFSVPRVTLDEEGLDPVGFLKIDAEDHESHVIDGARRTIERDRPAILMEILDFYENSQTEPLLAGMEELGYTGYMLAHGSLIPLSRARPNETTNDFFFLPIEQPTQALKGR